METLPSVSAGLVAEQALKSFGPDKSGQETTKEKIRMSDNRVLIRRGARELDYREAELVGGSIRTATLCTFDPQFGADGDVSLGEC
jgi:hypothetical protein